MIVKRRGSCVRAEEFFPPAIYDLLSASEIPDERTSATSGPFTIYRPSRPTYRSEARQ